MSESITQERALIFRIAHRNNVPWIMAHGMHCRNGQRADPQFVTIGNTDLIDGRHSRDVPCNPYGTLSDYVPFYFTPFSPMMLNIKTGRGGARQRPNEEIVIFVSSLPTLRDEGVRFLFTDRHAYLRAARFSDNLADLDWIDWAMLRRRDFKKDPEDPEKFERYQAETLAYQQVPMSAILGVVCYNDAVKVKVQQEAKACSKSLQVISRPGWYF
jgi:ssDNA thymidine ADP-ribosyltransferase, DarT